MHFLCSQGSVMILIIVKIEPHSYGLPRVLGTRSILANRKAQLRYNAHDDNMYIYLFMFFYIGFFKNA